MSVQADHGITDRAASCEFCRIEIVRGQHYIRLALMADTAGLERSAIDPPQVLWSGIFDSPLCAASGMIHAAIEDSTLRDVFGDPVLRDAFGEHHPLHLGDPKWLHEELTRRADAEEGPKFQGWPDRWLDAHLFRCTNGHVSVWTVKSEALGRDACPACMAPIHLTFPEDKDGPLE